MQELNAKIKKNLQSTTKLTPKEKAALQKMEDLGKNTNLTLQQQFQQAQAILDELSAAEKQQISQFVLSELLSPSPSS